MADVHSAVVFPFPPFLAVLQQSIKDIYEEREVAHRSLTEPSMWTTVLVLVYEQPNDSIHPLVYVGHAFVSSLLCRTRC